MNKKQLIQLIKEELVSVLKERYETSIIDEYIAIIGYDDIEQFLEDNPGAIEALQEWIFTIPDFVKKLRMQGHEEML